MTVLHKMDRIISDHRTVSETCVILRNHHYTTLQGQKEVFVKFTSFTNICAFSTYFILNKSVCEIHVSSSVGITLCLPAHSGTYVKPVFCGTALNHFLCSSGKRFGRRGFVSGLFSAPSLGTQSSHFSFPPLISPILSFFSPPPFCLPH